VPVLEVNGPQLTVVADACRDIRTSMDPAVVNLERPTLAVRAALPGWRTGVVLEELQCWWADDLGRFARRLEGTADGLEACARDYAGADEANSMNFETVLYPM
jgi:hypothetical protein